MDIIISGLGAVGTTLMQELADEGHNVVVVDVNGDKVEKAGLHAEIRDGAVFFDEAYRTVVGRKLFAQPLCEEAFVLPEIVKDCYPNKDFHTMYVGEILEIIEK